MRGLPVVACAMATRIHHKRKAIARQRADWRLDRVISAARKRVERRARLAARPKTGIYARTMLPSPTYDHCFRLVYRDGDCFCEFKRDGSVSHIIADYFEPVPAPHLDPILSQAAE